MHCYITNVFMQNLCKKWSSSLVMETLISCSNSETLSWGNYKYTLRTHSTNSFSPSYSLIHCPFLYPHTIICVTIHLTPKCIMIDTPTKNEWQLSRAELYENCCVLTNVFIGDYFTIWNENWNWKKFNQIFKNAPFLTL